MLSTVEPLFDGHHWNQCFSFIMGCSLLSALEAIPISEEGYFNCWRLRVLAALQRKKIQGAVVCDCHYNRVMLMWLHTVVPLYHQYVEDEWNTTNATHIIISLVFKVALHSCNTCFDNLFSVCGEIIL